MPGMSEKAILDAYRDVHYDSKVFWQTHPLHIAALASLYSLSPAEPGKARVLELGCGTGENLNAIARSLPSATLLGIDLVQEQIEVARKDASRAKLDNVQFVAADLLDYDFAGQGFDYIIAHGLLSWVPDAVKTRVFEVCRDHLSEQGLAYISYNVYPGWSTASDLNQLVRLEAADARGTDAKLASVKGTLQFLEDVFDKAEGQAPLHVQVLREEIAVLRAKSDNLVLHDNLGFVNDPFYFHQFVERAGEHGLTYVSDSALHKAWASVWPSPLLVTLGQRPMSRLRAEQYYDLVVQQRFRASLLCRSACEPTEHLDPERVRRLYAWMTVKPTGDTAPGKPTTYQQQDGKTITIEDQLVQALFHTLHQVASLSGAVTVQDVINQLRQAYPGPMQQPGIETQLCMQVLLQASEHRINLSAAPLRRGT